MINSWAVPCGTSTTGAVSRSTSIFRPSVKKNLINQANIPSHIYINPTVHNFVQNFLAKHPTYICPLLPLLRSYPPCFVYRRRAFTAHFRCKHVSETKKQSARATYCDNSGLLPAQEFLQLTQFQSHFDQAPETVRSVATKLRRARLRWHVAFYVHPDGGSLASRSAEPENNTRPVRECDDLALVRGYRFVDRVGVLEIV